MFEFAPLLLFLAAYFYKDIFFALIVLMIAMPIGLLLKYLKTRKLDKMFFWSTVMLYPFGGLSLYFREAEFLFWKPTIFYWIVSAVVLISQFVGEKPLVRRFIDVTGELPTERLSDAQWRNLNLTWVGFFIAMGVLNIYVAYNFTEQFWVNFKVFGLLAITMVFIFVQVFWIASKINEGEPPESEEQA